MCRLAHPPRRMGDHGCHAATSVGVGPFFFKLVEPLPVHFFPVLPLGLTRFHILNTTFCRIVVTSSPALHPRPSTKTVCLTPAAQRQARLLGAAQGKRQARSAHWRPRCNPTLLTRENPMPYQSQIPYARNPHPARAILSASASLTVLRQTRNSCVFSGQGQRLLVALNYSRCRAATKHQAATARKGPALPSPSTTPPTTPPFLGSARRKLVELSPQTPFVLKRPDWERLQTQAFPATVSSTSSSSYLEEVSVPRRPNHADSG